MSKVLISVIIPTYKRNDYLKRAIESVLKQDGNYEVIVVDDNNPDTEYRKKNELLMAEYDINDKVTYVKHDKNKNGSAARNTGIKISKGTYVTFLDDDDEFLDNRISSIEEYIKKYDVDLLCSGIVKCKNGYIEKKIMPNIDNKDLIYGLLCQKSFFETGSNLICKKSIIEKIGYFDERFKRHQDMEFAIRFLEATNKIKVIQNYSVVKNNDDRSNVPDFDKMVEVKELYLNKFKYLIDKYSDEEKKKIYELNYYQLLMNAYNKNDKKDIRKSKNFLKSKKLYNYLKDIKCLIKIKIKKLKFIKLIRNGIARIGKKND